MGCYHSNGAALLSERHGPQVIQENGRWRIPEGTPRPGSQKPETVEPKKFSLVNQIKSQRSKNNNFGIYEYIQVNLAYSSNRIASNRLTRERVDSAYIKTAMQDAMTSAAIIAPRMIAVILVALGGIFSMSFNKAGKKKPITTKIRTSQITEIGNAI